MPRNPAFLSQSGGLLRRLGLPVLASLAVLASTALAPSTALATVPSLLAIEGTLLAAAGAPAADGYYNVTFAVFKDATGGNPLWIEGPVSIAVKSGVFTYTLGTKSPLGAAVFSGLPNAYLSMQIASDAELPRQPLVSVAYALRAAVAEGLECSGCVGANAIDPQVLAAYAKSSDLAGYAKTTDLSAYAKSAGLAKVATSGAFADLTGGPDLSSYAKLTDLAAYAKASALAKVAGTGAYADLSGTPDLTGYAKTSDLSAYVKAASLAKVAGTGAYADLSGLPVQPVLGKTCGTGLVMNGINADGSYACIASAIAADMIDEISNGLIWNQFVDSTAGAVGTKIPDGLGAGVTDTLNFPDIGVAQKIWVNMVIANSDLSGVRVELYGPGISTPYVLYNGGKTGTALTANFNTDLAIVSGDMNKDWVGQNIKGAWSITVKDLKAGGGSGSPVTDGTFSWSLNIQTLSNQKIQIKGNLIVDKDLTVTGNLNSNGGNLNLGTAGMVTGLKAPKMATYRYAFFNTYVEAAEGWMRGDNNFYFGGVAPSSWTNGNATAANISADKETLRTLFTNKGYAGKNALLWSEVYLMYSSTNSRVFLSLFRVRNTTNADINWPVYWTYTAYTPWGENSSIALNGTNVWNSPCDSQSVCDAGPINVTIPKGRTSTVIFQSTGAQPYSWGYNLQLRKIFQGFYNNSLVLPTGLEYIDDLDTATGGWEQ